MAYPRTESAPEAERVSEASRLVGNLTLGSCHSAALAASRSAFALVAIQLGAPAWSTGVLMALFGFVPGLVTVQLGRCMDRFGRLPVLAASMSTVIVALTLAALQLNLPALLVAAPLMGIYAVLSHVGAAGALGAVQSKVLRARNLGYLALCYSVAHFVGPLLAGVVLDMAGARWVFVAIAIFPGISLAILLHGRARGHTQQEAGAASVQKGGFMALLRLRVLRQWLVVNAVFSAVLTIFPFVASLQADRLALSATQAGWIIAASALGSVVIRAMLPALLRRFRQDGILAGAAIATGLAYGCIPLLPDFFSFLGLSFVLGLAVGVGMPISTTLIYSAAPEGRVSETLALSMSVSMILQSLTALTLGFLISLLGMLAMGASVALLMIWVAFYSRPHT